MINFSKSETSEERHIPIFSLDKIQQRYAKTFESLKETDKRDFSKLQKYLADTSFFTDPAAEKYHNNRPHGLAYHSWNVYKNLNLLLGTYSIESENFNPFIVAVCHDLNKVGSYEIGDYNRKVAGTWVNFLTYKKKKSRDLLHDAELSVHIAMQLVELTEPEILAIRYQNGAFDYAPSAYAQKQAWDSACSVYPEVLLTHHADHTSVKFDELIYSDEEVSKFLGDFQSKKV